MSETNPTPEQRARQWFDTNYFTSDPIAKAGYIDAYQAGFAAGEREALERAAAIARAWAQDEIPKQGFPPYGMVKAEKRFDGGLVERVLTKLANAIEALKEQR